jgi:sugar phosphate isomerase/epimerase
MPVFGYHAVYEPDFESAIRSARDCGFQYVQFDLNVPRFFIDPLPRRRLKDLRAFARDLDVGIALHAPGDNVGLFTDYPAIRRGVVDHFRTMLEKANHLGARHLTVHPLNPPSFRRADTLRDGFQDEYAEYFKTVLKENLSTLADAAGEVLLLVENCDLGRIAEKALAELLAERPDVFLALDWAKMHIRGPVEDKEQRAFFLRHKDRLRELHLHDLDPDHRSHLKPGQGCLDFRVLFEHFYAADQWLTVEVRPAAEAAEAKKTFLKILMEQRQGQK